MKRQLLLLSIWVFFGMLLLGACRKKETLPRSTAGTIEFSMVETNGLFNIKAGEDDFYLFTRHGLDSMAGAYEFVASFEKLQPDCDSICNEYLRITLRDASPIVFPQQSDLLDLLINNLPYTYDGTTSIQQLEYTLSPSASGAGPLSVNYKFNDDPMFPGAGIFDTTVVRDLASPIKTVFLEVTDAFNCVSSVERVFDNNGLPSCNVSILNLSDSTVMDTLLLAAQGTSLSAFNLNWANNVSNSDSAFYPILPQQFNTGAVTLTSADCSATASVGIYSALQAGIGDGICAANLSIGFDTVTVNISNPQRSIMVEYGDPAGVVYSSRSIVQPNTSFVNFTNIADYQNNENGSPTRSMDIAFRCFLQSFPGNTVQVSVNNGRIAFAYPN